MSNKKMYINFKGREEQKLHDNIFVDHNPLEKSKESKEV